MKLIGLFGYFIVLMVLVVMGVFFARDNSYFVSLGFMGREFTPVPLWVLIFASFFTGVLLAAAFFSWEIIRLNVQKRKLTKSCNEMKEIIEKKIEANTGSGD
jgi:uncharacterized integral membrane protein